MRMDERRVGDVLIVKPLDGTLDAHAAAGFKQRIEQIILGGTRRIVLNMENVEFLDSTGLGVIVSSVKRLGGSGRMVLCCAGEMVGSVLELTRMDRVLGVLGDEEGAVAALSG